MVTKAEKDAKLTQKLEAETSRVKELYSFEERIAALPGATILGLDEVGRGPLAGPLTVGGVVLKRDDLILWINDSKKLTPKKRDAIASDIRDKSLCCKTFSVSPKEIDNHGLTRCLKNAFASVVKLIEQEGIAIDVILLDGNPLSFDSREVNVIKGDGKCASIAAASIVAKVERDSYMEKISDTYIEYNFAKNKGYGTAEHINAIKKHGLCDIHRKSFCTSFMQMSLF